MGFWSGQASSTNRGGNEEFNFAVSEAQNCSITVSPFALGVGDIGVSLRVLLGYRAAGDTAVAYAGKDMHAAFPKDSNGEDIERFSIVEHVETVTCLRVNRKFLS